MMAEEDEGQRWLETNVASDSERGKWSELNVGADGNRNERSSKPSILRITNGNF